MKKLQAQSLKTYGQFILLLFMTGLFASFANAHEMRPTVADIAISAATAGESQKARVLVRANLEKLMAEIGPEHDDSDSAPNRQLYDSLRAMDENQLALEYAAFEQRLVDGIEIRSGAGRKIALQNVNVDIPAVADTSVPRDSTLSFDLELFPADKTFTWQWQKSFGELILRADYDNAQDPFSALLAAGQRSTEVSLAAATTVSLFETITSYIVVGFEHIIPLGLDHILFVIGIFLLSTKFKPLILQVTVFTVAHTFTLMLASLKIVTISGSIVEPLIAASIVYVCIENIFHQRTTRWRLLVVFCFGLLHGLGFASVLGDVGISATHFVAALLAFNVGVEIGQLAVILGCFLLLGIWSKKHWYNTYLRIPLSLLIGAVGLYWFVERVMG